MTVPGCSGPLYGTSWRASSGLRLVSSFAETSGSSGSAANVAQKARAAFDRASFSQGWRARQGSKLQRSASKADALSVELRARFAVQRPLFSAFFCFRVFGTGEVPRHFKHHSNGRKPALAGNGSNPVDRLSKLKGC